MGVGGRRSIIAVVQLRVVPAFYARSQAKANWWVHVLPQEHLSWEGLSPEIVERAAHGHIESRVIFHGGEGT